MLKKKPASRTGADPLKRALGFGERRRCSDTSKTLNRSSMSTKYSFSVKKVAWYKSTGYGTEMEVMGRKAETGAL